MSNSTLDLDNTTTTPDRVLGRGHGTGALGPSDTSDSGSDVSGASGMARDTGTDMPLEENGNTSQLEHGVGRGAGPDLGDAQLQSDTDSNGTGERGAAGRDFPIPPGGDISPDRLGQVDEIDNVEDEDKSPFTDPLSR